MMNLVTRTAPVILVVDDDPVNLQTLFDALTKEQYTVLVADNGDDALTIAAKHIPDVILLDILMPRPDGFATCRRLKTNAAAQRIPVIFLTSLTENISKITGFEAGGVDYITKPFDLPELFARIATHVNLHRLQEELEAKNARLHEEIAARQRIYEQNQALLAALPDLMFLVDDARRIIEAHAHNSDDLHLPPERVLGKTVGETLPPPIAQAIEANIQAVLKTGTPQYLEYALESAGRRQFYESRCVPCGARRVLSIVRDITERKTFEDALRRSEERYRDLVENINDAVYQLDTNGIMTYISPAIALITGYAAEDYVGRHFSFALLPEDMPRATIQFQRIFSERIPSSEYRLRHKTQPFVWARLSSRPIIENDRIVGMQGVVVDITTRKQAEEAAQAASRAKSQFLATMSHELRTPLNGILGYAQLLQIDREMPPKFRQAVNTIRQSGEHLLELINDVLDIAKIEAGKIEVLREAFPLRRALSSVMDMMRGRAAANGIAFLADLPDLLPEYVIGDEKRLRQVLLNLLGNAIKFTPGGEVIFRVALRRNDAHGTDRLRFEVEDTGIGIPADKLQEIFLPFHQIGDARSHAEGTGLGLSISREIVSRMGGDLGVESALERGSRFWFEIPLRLPNLRNPAAPMNALSETPAQQADAELLAAEQIRKRPAPPDLRTLLYASQIGDVVEIRGILSRLEADDADLRTFTTFMRQRVDAFDMLAMTELLTAYLQESR